jgi:hypothetical protein
MSPHDVKGGLWQFNIVRTPLRRWYLREARHHGQVVVNVTINYLVTFG